MAYAVRARNRYNGKSWVLKCVAFTLGTRTESPPRALLVATTPLFKFMLPSSIVNVIRYNLNILYELLPPFS